MSITFSAWRRHTGETTWYERMAGSPELNVSNANGWALQAALGLEPDYSGGLPARELHGRCLAALALPDGDQLDLPSDPASQALLEALGAGPESGPTVIVVVRREGYVAEKLALLADLCVWADEHDADEVGWA